MSEQIYTIGELARLSGLSVRRLRFYSDKGLLPPAARTEAGYRMYSGDDAARLDLIRALRAAGVSLANVGRIMSRRLSLRDVLKLRLEALEAEIVAQRRVAAVLRATLRLPEPTESDLRRLWTVTTLSNAQFRTQLERFYDRAAEGARMSDDWKRRMLDAGTPTLPDDPTPEQIDAWTELTAMITDEAFLDEIRADATQIWNADFDPAAYAEAADATLAQVRAAIARGLAATSPEGTAIAQVWLASSAKAMKRSPDAAFLDWQLAQYRRRHGRSARYQALLAILRGDTPQAAEADEWRWINDAMTPLLAPTA